MSETNHGLGDRLRGLVAGEEPSLALRGDIEERLLQPLPRSGAGSRVLVLATVAALVVGTVALANGRGPFGADEPVTALSPAASADRSAPALSHGRSSTRVLVSNATRTPGVATAALQRLEAAGYVGAGSLDAPELSPASRIYFAPGYEAEALDVARLLGLRESAVNRTPPAYPEPNRAEVLVLIGADLAAG